MSDLDELKRKIYAKTPNVGNRPQGSLSLQKAPVSDVGWQQKPLASFFARHIWYVVVAVLVLFGGAVFLLSRGSFAEDKVQVNVVADSQVNSIQPVGWQVTINNTNSINLQEVQLTFEYPDNAQPLDEQISGKTSVRTIGILEAGKSAQRTFKARLFGQEDELQKVRILLQYKTPGISRTFAKEQFSQVRISASPLQLTFKGPDTVRSDGLETWRAIIDNNSDSDLENVRLRLEYPKGFSFVGSNPGATVNNTTWQIPSLKVGQEKIIEIQGKLSGALSDQKELDAFLEIGKQQNNFITLTKKIAASTIAIEPMALDISANGGQSLTAYAGQTITFGITYKNNTQNQTINDVAIEGQLVSDAIDKTSIQTTGQVDPLAAKIRWDFNNTPALKEVLPSQDGKVSFTVNVKNKLPIQTPADKNFQIRLVATITTDNPSTSLPASQVANHKEFVAPVATNLQVQVDGDYQHNGPFPNSGGVPPTAQRQTTYTLYWRITNTSNDVHELSLVATLPDHSTFTGLKQANFEADNLYYDASKRQMVWTIKNLRATTGFALPTYEAAFQIGLTPEQKDVGSIIDILGSTQVKGIDAFTNQVLNPPLIPPLRTDLGGRLRKGEATVIQ